jgi:uncharacterized protein (DUF362 family)
MISRREFIRRSFGSALGVAGSSVLAACAPVLPTPAPSVATSPIPAPIETPVAPATATRVVSVTTSAAPVATMTATPILPAAGEPYLVVVRGASPAALVRAAIDSLGGIKKFVKPGNDVILKPNICNAPNSFEYASTTNPEVMAELVKMCLEAGAKRVRAMDLPINATPLEAYKRSGIREAVEKAGGEMEIMSAAKYVMTSFPATARDIKSLKIYQDILTADVVINVPIAKHHSSARLTLSRKAMMGLILDRNTIHTRLGQRIADLNTVIKPTLNIIDGVRVLMDHGPTGGNLKDVKLANTLIASHDPVAADAYAAQILFNKKPEDIDYIKYGAEMGIGRFDFNNLQIKQVTV